MWSATTALPLGLLNDLLAGHPIGQSMALWTITFLAFDLLDSRVLFRDYWMDWFFAALAILFSVWSGWLIGQLMGSSVADRKGVGWGKSVSVRVELGGHS